MLPQHRQESWDQRFQNANRLGHRVLSHANAIGGAPVEHLIPQDADTPEHKREVLVDVAVAEVSLGLVMLRFPSTLDSGERGLPPVQFEEVLVPQDVVRLGPYALDRTLDPAIPIEFAD